MRVIRFGKRVYGVIAEYERYLDYDAAACLLDRANALEKDLAALRLTIADTHNEAIVREGPGDAP